MWAVCGRLGTLALGLRASEKARDLTGRQNKCEGFSLLLRKRKGQETISSPLSEDE